MTIKQIEAALEEGQSLKEIAQAYSEIASLKVKRLRAEVERNRVFFNELISVYGLVKALAIKKKVAITKPKKRLYILITSNFRFYGNINSSLLNYFIGSTRQLQDVDRLILGKVGINFFKATKLLPDYKEVVLKNDMPTPAELMDLVKLSSEYNQVLVYHTKMKSLLSQMATFTDITAVSLYMRDFYTNSFNTAVGENTARFIFEPELFKILQFFDHQILTLLLEQTFLESELSRTASRFVTMDQAENEANKFIKEYQTLRAYAKRSLANNAILENFATMIAVRRDK